MKDLGHTGKFTLLGIITIIIWGTSAAFTKNLSTGLGPYTAAAIVNLLSGVIVLGTQVFRKGGLAGWKGAPLKYWINCGFLFVLYTATSYISMEMVSGEEEIMTLVLIRFLWPLFTLVLTIPILKQKASGWLILSVGVSLMGIVAAKTGGEIGDFGYFVRNILSGNLAAYLIGLIVSLSWAFYTNLTKKYLAGKEVDGVGIYMLVSGIILGLISFTVQEPKAFTPRLVWELLYQAIAVSCIANVLWNLSIKKGNMLIVVLASNFLPIISTVMTAWMLGLNITLPVLIGSLLVVIGTMWSKWCFAVKLKENISDQIQERKEPKE